MINNKLSVTGALKVQVHNQNGELVQEQELKNLVVDAGKNLVANRLKDNVTATVSHIAVGTSATAAAAGQTTLVAETGRAALTSATVVGAAITYIATLGAGVATGTLLEAGLFNDPTTGIMLSRTANINVVKSSTDTLTITWTITVS